MLPIPEGNERKTAITAICFRTLLTSCPKPICLAASRVPNVDASRSGTPQHVFGTCQSAIMGLSWAGRPFRAKTYVSVLHAMLWREVGCVLHSASPGLSSSSACIARKVIPLVSPPVCCGAIHRSKWRHCVQYGLHAMTARSKQAIHAAVRMESVGLGPIAAKS